MAAIWNFDLRNPRRFEHDPALVKFQDGVVSLKLQSDFINSIIANITPTEAIGGPGTGLDNISDDDPSTAYVDSTAGPSTQLVWDLDGFTHVAGVDFTMSLDRRLWDLLVIEVDDTALFPAPTVIYASGAAPELAAHVPPATATDPNIALSSVSKRLRDPVRCKFLRITWKAAATSPTPDRVLTTMKVYGATYPITNPRLITAESIDTIDLATLVETATIPAGTAIGYSFLVNGQEWYYDGFAWQKANGTFLQSSSSATLAGNLSTLLSQRSTSRVRVIFYLHTTDPAETPELSDLSLAYDDALPTVNVPITRLTGIIRDGLGNPLVNANVVAEFIGVSNIKYTLNDVRIIPPAAKTVKTDTNGHFTVEVVPTTTMIPSSGLPADNAQWRLTISSTVAVSGVAYSEVLTDEVSNVEEVDIYQSGFGS